MVPGQNGPLRLNILVENKFVLLQCAIGGFQRVFRIEKYLCPIVFCQGSDVLNGDRQRGGDVVGTCP